MQWRVIEALMQGRRILLIEKTGFGKSLCYQFPATQLHGLTIVFSPLIALMRDQVRAMHAKGVRAACLNSNQSPEENNHTIALARDNQLDLLYIAPERMENAEWITAAREMKIALVVIDEAHCISLWGQSFRPNYRRIVHLVRLLPAEFPVLAATATATPRVQSDIIEQIGSNTELVRGTLLRPNIRLVVHTVGSEEEKMLWLARHLPPMERAGIVYTGTQINTEVYSRWLQHTGVETAAYNGRMDGDQRQEVEENFIANKYHCVVSTNALGMGIDKSDIRFIVHTQMPQSPIHYYQEVGRAGRDGRPAVAVLLYNPAKDHNLPLAFIDASKPAEDKYLTVLEVVRHHLLGMMDIASRTNCRRNEIGIILSDLVEQGLVHEQMVARKKMYFYNPDARPFDFSLHRELRAAQLADLQKMKDYVDTPSCRMSYLCHYLGDAAAEPCGHCDREQPEPAFTALADEKERLLEFYRTYHPELDLSGDALHKGYAATLYGLAGSAAIVAGCKAGTIRFYPPTLAESLLHAVHTGLPSLPSAIVAIPSATGNEALHELARRTARALGIPYVQALEKRRATTPQRDLFNAALKKKNVEGSFRCSLPVADMSILLLDDYADTGYTLKAAAAALHKAGATAIYPFAVAKMVAGNKEE